ncbi:MAG: ArsC/Spx/MgsR family protein [bacterium]
MSSIKIWHNPRCSKSRQGLEYLTESKCDLDIFEYTKEKIDPAELARVIKMSDQPLEDFIRTNEAEYAELGLKGKDLTIEQFAEIAAQHPKLLQRPIVIKNGKAIIARPTSKIAEL